MIDDVLLAIKFLKYVIKLSLLLILIAIKVLTTDILFYLFKYSNIIFHSILLFIFTIYGD